MTVPFILPPEPPAIIRPADDLWVPRRPGIIRPNDDVRAYVNGPPGFLQSAGNDTSLHGIIASFGLASGLVFAVDAGSAASYDGTSQTFSDQSAAGNDFFLGVDGTSDATDPTFNGTAGGLSSSEYFSVDGGDSFRLASTNPAAVENIHQDGAQWCALVGFRTAAGVTTRQDLIGTYGNSNSGFSFYIQSSDMRLFVYNSGGAAANFKISDGSALSGSTDYMGAVSVDEPTGAGGGFFWLNGAYAQVSSSDTWTATYSSPDTGNAAYTLELFSRGNGINRFSSGARFYFAALWQGVVISKANLDAIRTEINGRTGFSF